MANEIRQASLLGLPTELRLKIYEYAIEIDVDCTIVSDIYHSTGSSGTQAILLPGRDFDPYRHIPLLTLPSTCRTITADLRSSLTRTVSGTCRPDRTYELDVDVENRPGQKALRSVTWRRLPCAPDQAEALVMNVKIVAGTSSWTEGGPASLVSISKPLSLLLHPNDLVEDNARSKTTANQASQYEGASIISASQSHRASWPAHLQVYITTTAYVASETLHQRRYWHTY